jgi:DNA-binding HxlR family transcriptional regulator
MKLLDAFILISDFQKSLGIAKNILSDRLRTLTERGILKVVPSPDRGAHQENHVTAMGRGLFPVMVALRQWGNNICLSQARGTYGLSNGIRAKRHGSTSVRRTVVPSDQRNLSF